MNPALELLDPLLSETLVKLGPSGGNLNNPAQHPERRKASYQDNGTGFHNSQPKDTATMGIQKEQPWHKMAAYMLVAGRTNSEIALAAGVTPTHVSILRSQRWFQELLATIANREGEEVTGAIKSLCLEAVEGIYDLAKNSENERVQLTAWTTLLEQGQGKAVQKVISSRTDSRMSPAEEYEQIQRDLKALHNAQESAT